MDYITTVTQKGQITLPKMLRDSLGVKTYEKVRVIAGVGHIKIYPTQDILEITKRFTVKSKKSVIEARKELEKNYIRR